MNCRKAVKARHKPKMPPCARRLRMIVGVEMYAEGVPLDRIAAVAGYSANGHITGTARRRGLPSRGTDKPDAWTDSEVRSVLLWRSSGISYEDIGAAIGRTKNAVKLKWHQTKPTNPLIGDEK